MPNPMHCAYPSSVPILAANTGCVIGHTGDICSRPISDDRSAIGMSEGGSGIPSALG